MALDTGTKIILAGVLWLFIIFSVLAYILSLPTQYEYRRMKEILLGEEKVLILPHHTVTPLHQAAQSGDIERMKIIIANNPKLINAQDDKLNTPLHRACALGVYAGVNLLLSHHADPNIVNIADRAPLHYAIQHSHNHLIELLLEYDADVNLMAHDQSPMWMAVSSRNLEVVSKLLKKGAHVSTRDGHYTTPIHIAASRGYTEILELLLTGKDANVNAKDLDSETPLYMAVYNNYCNLVPLLIKAGASTTYVYGPKKNTLLHLAAEESRVECVKALLMGEAKVDVLNENNETPLFLGVKAKSRPVVEVLMEWKADKNLGKDPLLVADEEILKLLKNY